MTDATTGPGANEAAGRGTPPGHDRLVAPTPTEGTGHGTDETAGRETAGRETAGRETAPGHDRLVAPTPHEAADPGAPAPGTAPRSTEDLTDPTGRTDHTGTAEHKSPTGHSTGGLLPHDECDKLELRLRNAVAGFVDSPKAAVEEADHVVEEIAGRFTEALTRRRRTLRTSWHDGQGAHDGKDTGAAKATHPDTEQLRLALRDYRELAERLLRG
ncbi:hypothetical protein AB0H97_08330 [Streptomyces sp. NPDC050788]|jgi:hypothetical protein|uniref:hypothetical protein n=1 Tax=Streptomyces sp. NPDC050788 TaxID=3155041 RepID=UPI0034385A36